MIFKQIENFTVNNFFQAFIFSAGEGKPTCTASFEPNWGVKVNGYVITLLLEGWFKLFFFCDFRFECRVIVIFSNYSKTDGGG